MTPCFLCKADTPDDRLTAAYIGGGFNHKSICPACVLRNKVHARDAIRKCIKRAKKALSRGHLREIDVNGVQMELSTIEDQLNALA